MADYSPNPSSPAQYLEVEAQNSPINQYLKAQQEQAQVAAAGQTYQQKALQLQYAPQDLYNQAMQTKMQTLKSMGPLDLGLIKNLTLQQAQPIDDITKMAAERNAAMKQNMSTQMPQTPGVQAPNLPQAIQNVGQMKGKIPVPQEGGLNSVMPQIAQQIAQQKSMGQMPQQQMPVQQMQIGPDQMTQSQPPMPPQAQNFSSPPTGVMVGDSDAVQQMAARTDVGSLLSEGTEKVLPPALTAEAMMMRMMPTAIASMSNNAQTSLDKESAITQKQAELALKEGDLNLYRNILAQQALVNSTIHAQEVHPGQGNHGSKDPQLAADKSIMDKLNSDITSKESGIDPTDKYERKQFEKNTVAPLVQRAYNQIKSPMYRDQLKNGYPDVQFGAVNPNQTGSNQNVQVRIKTGFPGEGTIVNRPIGIFQAHPEIYEQVK